jgi:hypothetical protein
MFIKNARGSNERRVANFSGYEAIGEGIRDYIMNLLCDENKGNEHLMNAKVCLLYGDCRR